MRKDRYQKARVAAGLCGNCGVGKPKKGCTDCLKCLRRKNLTQMDLRQERKERGLCPGCGGKKLKDRWGCKDCLEARRQATARYKAKLKGKR